MEGKRGKGEEEVRGKVKGKGESKEKWKRKGENEVRGEVKGKGKKMGKGKRKRK